MNPPDYEDYPTHAPPEPPSTLRPLALTCLLFGVLVLVGAMLCMCIRDYIRYRRQTQLPIKRKGERKPEDQQTKLSAKVMAGTEETVTEKTGLLPFNDDDLEALEAMLTSPEKRCSDWLDETNIYGNVETMDDSIWHRDHPPPDETGTNKTLPRHLSEIEAQYHSNKFPGTDFSTRPAYQFRTGQYTKAQKFSKTTWQTA